MRYVTGFPDRPPVRPNLSVGDTLASLHGVIGALLALHHVPKGHKGQIVDVALYESVFNVTESLLPEYDAQGEVPWTSTKTQQEVLKAMDEAEVPAGRIYSAADIAADPHYAARGMIQQVLAGDGEPLKVPGIIPKLSATPGAIRTPAPKLGEHTDEVLKGLGFSEQEIASLRGKNAI